ncbi:MAG: DUF4350 domain-containing protein [Planctomycetota bacterium]|jgi:hypothetical protein
MKNRTRIALAAILLAGPAAHARTAQTDLTTGLSATPCAYTAIPEPAGAVNVLWDLTHGIYLDYEPAGRFSGLVGMLSGMGYGFTTTDAGIDNIDLSPYDILVICVGSSWDSPYTASEVSAVQSFMQGGGRVLILGDNAGANPQNINPIAEALGTTTGIANIEPYDTFFSNFAPHPIFEGIGTIYFRAAGELASVPPSQPVAWTDLNELVISVVNPPVGDSCAVILGDINVFGNNHWLDADNQAFAVNVFDWLATCTPVAHLDIKPGSCPNSFNRRSNGVLPVALVGTEGFDVAQVDLATVQLSRADGVGGSVTPSEGPPGPQSVLEDVTTPFAGDPCDCDELPADGIMDLSMKFWSNEVVEALELGDLSPGDFVELELSGTLLDGTEFAASDCIRLVPPGVVNGDGAVGVTDLLDMLAGWGTCPAPPAECLADIDDDDNVGVVDLLGLLANWGQCF